MSGKERSGYTGLCAKMKQIHDILKFLNECFPFLMIGIFFLAFMFAFAMMFMLPPLSLLILFGALYTLAIVVGISKLMKLAERKVAERLLNRGICPACGHESNAKFVSPCSSCLTNFESHPASGMTAPLIEVEPQSGSDHKTIIHS